MYLAVLSHISSPVIGRHSSLSIGSHWLTQYFLCAKKVYRVVRSSDHGDLSRKKTFDNAGLSNEETGDVKEELDEIDKKDEKVLGTKLTTINNNMKGSQLMTFRMNVIQLRLKLMFMNILISMLNKLK